MAISDIDKSELVNSQISMLVMRLAMLELLIQRREEERKEIFFALKVNDFKKSKTNRKKGG
ncbi:MAG: hypothetical protein COS99_00910 [Candidatus Omnitrophica bacterium CG07_land_8_20_14_0_80_42_15]|uniref:Uncharacterized protein n=1 Tax=Candidatus Aquitaenariimonas noxiae TaxID=1974741 RepID=A0A2J0L0Y8_9BACT|nr:MAG: hypothetical protein COS99_00910 [Candidatus Omnitrophica bacterium CG07_land_8_20_14_0_80_42_15]